MSGTGNRPKSSGPTPKWYKEAPTSSEEKEEGEVEEDDEEHMEYKHTVLAHGVYTGCQHLVIVSSCRHLPKQYRFWLQVSTLSVGTYQSEYHLGSC